VPSGGDLYLLKKVVHGWADAQARAIPGSCRAAMRPGAWLLLMEAVIPPGNGPSYAKLLDLVMLVYAGGQERTLDEHPGLLASAGLRLTRVVPTASALSIIEAVPA
jgi:hypothetical protein